MTTIASQITSIKAPRHWPWGGEFTGTVNSRTKGQLRGKCFHLMTSSCWIACLIAIQCQLIRYEPSINMLFRSTSPWTNEFISTYINCGFDSAIILSLIRMHQPWILVSLFAGNYVTLSADEVIIEPSAIPAGDNLNLHFQMHELSFMTKDGKPSYPAAPLRSLRPTGPTTVHSSPTGPTASPSIPVSPSAAPVTSYTFQCCPCLGSKTQE